MDINRSKETVHWIELLIASVVVGFILIGMAATVRTAMARERDALRRASLAATRAAIEEYAAVKGAYPISEKIVALNGGCIDAESGVVSKAERSTCSAVLYGIPSERYSRFSLNYQSTADGKGYALSSWEEARNATRVLCGTVRGITAGQTCLPVARETAL